MFLCLIISMIVSVVLVGKPSEEGMKAWALSFSALQASIFVITQKIIRNGFIDNKENGLSSPSVKKVCIEQKSLRCDTMKEFVL